MQFKILEEVPVSNIFDFVREMVTLANATGTLTTATVAVAPDAPDVLVIAAPGDTVEKVLGEYFADGRSMMVAA